MASVHGGVQTVVGAGLEGRVQRAAGRLVTGGGQGHHLGVGPSRGLGGAFVPPSAGRHHHVPPRDWVTVRVRTEAARASARRMASRSSPRSPGPGDGFGAGVMGSRVYRRSRQGFLAGHPDPVRRLPRTRRRRRWRTRPRGYGPPPARPGAAVSSSIPPSTSSSAPRPRRSSSCTGAGDLGQDLGHERLAPEAGVDGHARGPGRTSARYGSMASKGVSGLIASPARRPSPLAWSNRAAVSPTSTWTVQPSAPASRNASRIVPRVGHHQVAVEEQTGVSAQRRHHRWADGEVGDEVTVHDVDVEPGPPRR